MIKTITEIVDLNTESIDSIKRRKTNKCDSLTKFPLHHTEVRMLKLKQCHTICQEYILPIPYLCQMYHLLNLKHLEVVHGFSLKGLKIGNIGQFEATNTGGSIKFQTTLVSSFNILRIWRRPVVEVELTLHDLYTIELSIGIYGDRKINVIFNVLPLGESEHKLFINIYSNVGFFKPIFQILLHCASCLTVVEDMSYLHKLAKKNPLSLVESAKNSKCQTMQLFNRFIDLYESNLLEPILG